MSVWHSVEDLNVDGESLDLIPTVIEEDDLLLCSILGSVRFSWENVFGAALLAFFGSVNDKVEGCVGSGLILQLPARARGAAGTSVFWHFESGGVVALEAKEVVLSGALVAENEFRLRWAHSHGHGAKSSSKSELFHHCCCWLIV